MKNTILLLLFVLGCVSSINAQTSQTLTESFCVGTGVRNYAVDTADGANGTPGSTYSWSVTGTNSSTAVLSGATGNPISINWSATPAGSYVVHVVETASGCVASDVTLNVTINALPTTSIAGAAITQCNSSSFTLAGNNPTSGTGLWTVTTGTATITSPTSYNSGVTGITAGTSATLTWTISNGTCTPSTSTVVLTNNELPTTSNAGAAITQCNSSSFTLAGNNPTSGTGLWTVTTGTATITSPTSYNSGVTGITAGTSATLTWTISNGTCTPSTSTVVLTNNELPTTSNAGAAITQCNSSSFTLAGNNPTSGTGLWTVTTGTATITSPTSYNSGVTGITAGTSATLTWTISNGTCTPSTSTVVLNNNSLPTTSAIFHD